MSTPDPLQDDIDTYTHAYGLAAKAGDTDAMGELHNHLLSAYQAKSKRDNNPTNDMGTAARAIAGYGRGAARIIDTVGGWVGHNPELTSEDTDKPLLDTTAGNIGNVVGQIVSTLPVGMGGEAAAGALGIGKLAGAGLARTLGRVGARAAQAGSEGAAASALTGDDIGEGAGTGAALSVPLGAAGKLLKGVVGKSEAAQRLYQDADQHGRDLFIPISQGGTGPAKTVYQNVLPYALGAEGQLERQSKKAKGVMSEVAAEEGMPVQSGKVVPAPIGNTMEQTAQDMGSVYDKAYQNTAKSYTFNKPQSFASDVMGNLQGTNIPKADQAHIANTLEQILDNHADGGSVISGEQLLNAKQKAREALDGLRGPGGLYTVGNKQTTEKAMSTFDDIIQDEIDNRKTMLGGRLSPTNRKAAQQTVEDLENYKNLGPAYASGNAVMSTAEGNIAKRGEIKFGKLAENAPQNSPLRSMAQDAHEVLETESPGGVTPAGRHALHQFGQYTALPAAALLGHPIAAGAAQLTGNALATKTAQKVLYGDTKTQQALARALRNNPKAAALASYATRKGINANAQGQ